MTPFFSFENNLFLEEYFGRDKDGYKRYYFDFVGNKVKGQISKWVFQENKACQIFRKTNISYSLMRSKKCSFFRKFDMLCFLETSVLRFALLPYYRRFLDHGKVFM